MKKLIFLFLTLGFLFGEASAQNRSIQFKEGNWESLLQQAKKENKLIFLDCYTSWCGPCKMLAKTVFTNDTVADFYNKHFICAQMDMEKGEGPELAKRYNVRAYPTLLYVNKEGKLVHNVVGFQKPSKLVDEGNVAMNGTETITAYQQRYDKGERDEAFIRKFIDKLVEAYQPKMQDQVATEFIGTFDNAHFYSRDCWNIIIRNINNPMSPIIKKVFANRNRFYQIIAKDSVDMFLDYTFRSKVSSYTWSKTKSPDFNEQNFNEYLQYLQSVNNWDKVPQYIASLYTAKHWIDGDYRAMLDEMRQVLRYGIFRGDDELYYIQAYVIQLSKTDAKELMAETCNWMQQLENSSVGGYRKSEYMKLQATLLRALNQEEKAKTLEEQARKVRMS